MSRSEAIRKSILDAASVLRRKGALRTEAAALEADAKNRSPPLSLPNSGEAAAAAVLIRDHAALGVAVVAFLIFTVVSTATVGLTFQYFARRPGEAQEHLEGLRDRVVRAGPAIAAVLYLIVGLYLIIDGLRGLVNS